MVDDRTDSVSAHDSGLASLLRLGIEARADRHPEELQAVLKYHLQAPLDFDLATLPPSSACQMHALAAAKGLLLRSLDDLFMHPLPPLELLQMAKDYAKSCLSAAEAPMPKEVAGVLYYLAIGTALVRRNQRITELSDRELRQGLDSVLSLPWLDPPIITLLQEARNRLPPPATDKPS